MFQVALRRQENLLNCSSYCTSSGCITQWKGYHKFRVHLMFNYKPSTQPRELEYPSLPVTYWLFIYLIPDIYETVTAPDTALCKGIICIHCLCPVLFEQHRHGGTVLPDKVNGWLSWGQIYMCCYRLACDCERWNASYQKYKYTKYTDRKKVIEKSQFDKWVQQNSIHKLNRIYKY